MAPAACAPTRRAQLGWAAAVAALGALTGVVGLWLWDASRSLRRSVTCVRDGYARMDGLVYDPPACTTACTNDLLCECLDWRVAQLVFQQFPRAAFVAVDWLVALWTTATLAPAVLHALALLGAALLACLALRARERARRRATYARALNGAGLTLVTLVFVVFGVFGAVGLGTRIVPLRNLYNNSLTTPCAEQAGALRDLHTSGTSTWTAACAGSAVALCVETGTALHHVGNISAEFDGLCACAATALEQSTPLAAPGVVGVVLATLGAVAQVALCVAMRCCRPYALPAYEPLDERARHARYVDDRPEMSLLRL